MSGSVTKRFRWDEIEVFPGNPLLETRISQMAKRWGGYIPQVVGIPLVADNTAGAFPEYGPEAVVMVNGHHRQELAKQHGHGKDQVICELLRGRNREELHKMFRQVNDSRVISHPEKFLHRIGQKEPKALALVAVMEQEGFRPSTNNHGGGVETIHSTSTVEWIWDGGDRFLQKKRGKGPHRGAVTLALAAYRELAPERFTQQSALLKGLGAFYLRYPEADSERLLSRLRDRYPSAQKLLAAAKQAKEDFRVPNNYQAFALIARLAYNGNLAKNKLPEWK